MIFALSGTMPNNRIIEVSVVEIFYKVENQIWWLHFKTVSHDKTSYHLVNEGI